MVICGVFHGWQDLTVDARWSRNRSASKPADGRRAYRCRPMADRVVDERLARAIWRAWQLSADYRCCALAYV